MVERNMRRMQKETKERKRVADAVVCCFKFQGMCGREKSKTTESYRHMEMLVSSRNVVVN